VCLVGVRYGRADTVDEVTLCVLTKLVASSIYEGFRSFVSKTRLIPGRPIIGVKGRDVVHIVDV
jgi:hypothetical protein